jgi:hypothetical protein
MRILPVARILIVGGSGTFGRRIAELLGEAKAGTIIIAGRDAARTQAAATSLGAEHAHFDRDGDVAAQLAALAPDLVIDAAGPFQTTARDPYRLAKACIARGMHYVDIADGRDFVCGITVLDVAAKVAKVAVIAGASSVPALTGAVVAELAAGLDDVAAIDIALSASNRATAGPNVNAAILSYVGQPVRYLSAGAWRRGHGWGEITRRDFAVAGRAPIKGRLVALCDVPDLDLLPAAYPGCRNVIFRAGAELDSQNRSLAMLGHLVRRGWLDSLAGLAPLLTRLQNLMRFVGSDRSAMRIDLTGRKDGAALTRSWTLLAEDGHGPWVPSFAAALLALKILRQAVEPGARPAAGTLDLAAFQPLLAKFHLHTATSENPVPPSLYRRVMAAAFDRLPAVVRALHDFAASDRAGGSGSVIRGHSLLARLAARVGRFPPATDNVPVTVTFAIDESGETWTRNFGGHVFWSHLSARRRGGREILVERFGPFAFHFDLTGDETGLEMHLIGWRCCGIPLPKVLAPRISAREGATNGHFTYDVRIALPWGPLIIHYQGWLAPLPPDPAPSTERAP